MALGKIRLFEDILGLAPTALQRTIFSNVQRERFVIARVPRDERPVLIASLCLWYGMIAGSADSEIGAESLERAREIGDGIRQMHARVRRPFTRPMSCHPLYTNERQRILFGGRGDVTLAAYTGRLTGWSDLAIIEGADRMDRYMGAEIARQAQGGAPGWRVLILGETCSGALALASETEAFTRLGFDPP